MTNYKASEFELVVTPATPRIAADSADREAWLAARRGMVCASEAGVILGLVGSPARLWAEKRGAPGIDDAEHLMIGRLIEPAIRTIFRAQTGRVAVADGLLYARDLDGVTIGATLDGWCWDRVDDEASEAADLRAWARRVPFEIKNVSEWNAKEWTNGPPDHYVAQVQVQMLVAGADRAVICALIGGRRTEIFEVEADHELQQRFITAARAFWRRVESGECPPDVDHGKHVAETGGKVEWSLDTEEGQQIALLTKRADMLAAQLKALESEADDVRAQIKAAIGQRSEATVADLGGWSYTTSSRTTYREAKPGEKPTHVIEMQPVRTLRRKGKKT